MTFSQRFGVYTDADCTTVAKNAAGEEIATITLEIVNGAAVSEEIDGLVPGDYYVKELEGSNKSVDLDTSAHKVTVEADKTGDSIK